MAAVQATNFGRGNLSSGTGTLYAHTGSPAIIPKRGLRVQSQSNTLWITGSLYLYRDSVLHPLARFRLGYQHSWAYEEVTVLEDGDALVVYLSANSAAYILSGGQEI